MTDWTAWTGAASDPSAAARDPLADRRFLVLLGALYLLVSLILVAALDRFWIANWDAVTFLGAARTFWDGGSPFDLYEVSRATSPWPYAYPPLFALAQAPFVWLADQATGGPVTEWPQLVALRVPLWIAEIGIAALLHRIVGRATGEWWIARLAAFLWLFSPILFYHTALQAHLESLWLWPTLAAYAWLQERGSERLGWPLALLALALAIKQTALLFALPVGLWLLWRRRWGAIALWALLVAAIFGGLALPFARHSDDFRYMVFDYVAEMPVQIQSWQVWSLAFEGYLLGDNRTDFPTVRFAIWLTLALNVVVSVAALRRGRSWYAIGTLVTLGFLLSAPKAMAYHYPILLPFLIAFALRVRRFRLATLALLWTSWVLVSPYFAPWADRAHLPAYAALGTLNSLFYGWLLWRTLVDEEAPRRTAEVGELRQGMHLLRWGVLLATAFVLCALAHPARVALLAAMEGASQGQRLAALVALLALAYALTLALMRPLATWADRAFALPAAQQRTATLRPAHWGAAALFVPLFFTWFAMNAEITAVIEKGLIKAWGL